ncbi:uncharacterized protein LOC143143186 isoform X2 [Ptiloglossa arizonensis]|uniref:uncharacterized protein LOC143143186 isoform X2 n=1 Tax=Ptiloglossa arizonensis TaxID=3350558 RepID=UPI003FA025CC
MGNTGSTESSKLKKERKKKGGDGVDDRHEKNKRVANTSDNHPIEKDTTKFRCTNPFIIFFLRLRSKKPKEHVTIIARAAGKLWTQMSPVQRKKYVDLANAEKKRRQTKRKRKSRKRR